MSIVRSKYLETVAAFQPFSRMLDDGMTPSQVKEVVVAILAPYVHDKDRLVELSVSVLAGEAICVGQLLSRPDWKDILDLCFRVREDALSTNIEQALNVYAAFESSIREAQRKYSTLVVLEQNKADFSLEEYASEMFGVIGAVTESTIQPFLKELYCLAAITSGTTFNAQNVLGWDFGKVVIQLEMLLPENGLTAPRPWGIRVNQWRNIAQHHSYTVVAEQVVAKHGKSVPLKETRLTRDELFYLSKELIRRLGALKSSRELTILNYELHFREVLPDCSGNPYSAATELGAAFATQGFTLAALDLTATSVTADLRDAAPNAGPHRAAHCSQFVLPIATRFPGRDVVVTLQSDDAKEKWIFSIDAQQLGSLLGTPEPLAGLADALRWQKQPL